MRIDIPEFKVMAKCNEHMNHGPITIDLGPDVVEVVRCKNCKHRYSSDFCECRSPNDFCSEGEREKEAGNGK